MFDTSRRIAALEFAIDYTPGADLTVALSCGAGHDKRIACLGALCGLASKFIFDKEERRGR